jgi:hypothetical protein
VAIAFLRIAAGLALVQGVGHAAAVVRWAPVRGAREAAVVDAMKSQSFAFQGLVRSYWDFFFGYGLVTAFNCLVEAAVLWQVSRLVNLSDRSATTMMVAIFLIANLTHGYLSWRYFFFTPVIFDGAIVLCLMAALAAKSMATA